MSKTLAKPKKLEVRKGAGFAIASLILGIFSVILAWIPFFGWIFIILALVFSILALIKIKKGEASGRGMAIAGLVLGGIGLLFAILMWAFIYTDVKSSCTNMDCFISNANQCKPTIYVVTTEMGEIAYFIETDKTGNCIFTKMIAELSENEDPILKKALKGKGMECVYSPGKFNDQWTTSMIEGLQDCNGELKDAIGQLLLLV